MYRIVLACSGVPAAEGPTAAADVTKDFAQHRQWHRNVECKWDGGRLFLIAENDFDSNGMALMDEFSDCLAAYIFGEFDGDITVESVTQLEDDETSTG